MFTEQRLRTEIREGIEEALRLSSRTTEYNAVSVAAILQQAANKAHQLVGAIERAQEK